MKRCFLALAAAVLLVGCATEETTTAPGPPEGWTADSTRWWQVGQDTTGVFRNLETIDAMGLTEASASAGRTSDPLVGAVRKSLLPLFRNAPQVVDSLFEAYVAPELRETTVPGNVQQVVERYKRQGYQTIRRHFQEPQTARRLGEDIPVVYPDSLRERGVGGTVAMQVYVDPEGAPQAIELLEGVHPTLNALAMEATTQMRWRPAYLIRNGSWRPIPAWARFNITFGTP